MISTDYVASGSRLPLLAACAASCALPRFPSDNPAADVGSALHEHMADRIGLGLSGALERLDTVASKWRLDEKMAGIFRARAMHFDWIPPKGALPELALGLFEDGHVERVKGGRGSYVTPAGCLVPLQLDVMWAEPAPLYRDSNGAVRCPPGSVLNVADLKTGKEIYVDPIEINWQVIAAGLLAAIWTGADLVIPHAIFWSKGRGVWDSMPEPMGPEKLSAALGGLLALVERGKRQRALYAAGEPLEYRTGPKCLYCDCAPGCPAKLGAIKQLLGSESPLEPLALTGDQAASLAVLLPQLEQAAEMARAALVARADALGPIQVGPGRAWGPYVSMESSVDVEKMLPILGEEIGAVRAEAAVSRKLTKTAIDAAIKEAHAEDGISRQQAVAKRRVYGKAKDAGALVPEAKIKYGMHPAGELPIARAAMAQLAESVEIDGDPE